MQALKKQHIPFFIFFPKPYFSGKFFPATSLFPLPQYYFKQGKNHRSIQNLAANWNLHNQSRWQLLNGTSDENTEGENLIFNKKLLSLILFLHAVLPTWEVADEMEGEGEAGGERPLQGRFRVT